MLFTVLSVFGLAAVAPWLYRYLQSFTGWLLALLPLSLALYSASFLRAVTEGNTITEAYQWAPNLGVTLSFALDGLSLLFTLLIAGIGSLILVYAGGYMGKHPQLGRFYSFLLLFMGAMLGLVLSNNLLSLFIFWELTSISSFLLIGFSHEKAESRRAANQALLITGGGGLAMFAGFVMLGQISSFELSELLKQGDLIKAHPLYFPILILILLGAFTKSAQFPFHFWLPGAMEAPTPVSAYLHSATMVKAGVFLLARLSPALAGTTEWVVIVTSVGTITMLVGGIMAYFQTDLKRLLAYSTISALGILVLLLGLSTPEASIAAMTFLLAHALYKGALFMTAGIVDHETGTRDITILGGLRKSMPITMAIGAAAAFSLAGFGPILSFIGKELLLESVLHSAQPWLLTPLVVVAGSLFVTIAALVFIKPFLGAEGHPPKHPHDPPISMWLGPAILASLGIIFGFVPFVLDHFITAVASAVSGAHESAHLALWHGFNIALGLSVTSVLVGVGLFSAWQKVYTGSNEAVQELFHYGPSHWYNVFLIGTYSFARELTRLLQSGYLRVYLQTILMTAVGLVGWTLVSNNGLAILNSNWRDARFYEVGLAILIMASAFVAVRAEGRLTAITSLSVLGFCVSLFYVIFAAPDLAMTQILVETLTVILFVLVFYHLPRFSRVSSLTTRMRDMAVAGTTGGVITLLVLAVTAAPTDTSVTEFMAANSYVMAHGHNIVNVILVDFRGMDTMGEITVLSVAAIGVYALLKLRPRTGEK